MTDLQKQLQESNFEYVYLNEEGGWLFHPHPSFPNKVSRDEILNNEEKEEKETITKTTKKSNK